MPRVVAVLPEMWDWRGMTSGWSNDPRRAPPFFFINPENHTGKRLYAWLGHSDLLVTNACPELVGGPTERGTPDPV